MATSKTKPKNRLGTETVTASLTPGIFVFLEQLTDTHYFGRNANETASKILSDEVKRLSLSGELENLIAKAPKVAPRGPDAEDDSDDP
jgi:hypothetical protein